MQEILQIILTCTRLQITPPGSRNLEHFPNILIDRKDQSWHVGRSLRQDLN